MCRPSLCKPPNLFCGHESDPDITAVAWLKNTRWWVHLKVGGGRLVLYLATHVHWHMLRDLHKQESKSTHYTDMDMDIHLLWWLVCHG